MKYVKIPISHSLNTFFENLSAKCKCGGNIKTTDIIRYDDNGELQIVFTCLGCGGEIVEVYELNKKNRAYLDEYTTNKFTKN